jgi:ABC-2 type transport system ATP-binding protein
MQRVAWFVIRCQYRSDVADPQDALGPSRRQSHMTETVISTVGLTKRYGDFTAVDHVGLTVHEGDLFGFLGPNGAGKTTTIRMLLGLVYPTSGEIEILGNPMPRSKQQVLQRVGCLIEGPAFYPHLSGRTNLRLLDASGRGGARSSRPKRVRDAMERVGLAAVGNRPVKHYSSGMKQRLGLAAAMLKHHTLVVLDEPTNGLDPNGMKEIRGVMSSLVAEGTTVMLSSHLLSEVEQVCNRAAIVDRGRLVAQDEVARLLAPTGRVVVYTRDGSRAIDALSALPQLTVERHSDRIEVNADGVPPEELNKRLVDAGVRVSELVLERRTLEDVYMDLTEDAGGPDAIR